MADTQVKTVVPVVGLENKENKETSKLSQITSTIETDKESVVIVNDATSKLVELAFELQRNEANSFDNPSQYQRYMLEQGAIKELKYGCQQAIGRWKSLVVKMAGSPAYKGTKTQDEVELIAKGHPKCQTMLKAMERAVAIKKQYNF
jgi:hypothetical protein